MNMTDDELIMLAHSNRMKSKCRPIKDVVTVPRQGVVIMQFIADNPGALLSSPYFFMYIHFNIFYIIYILFQATGFYIAIGLFTENLVWHWF